MVEAVQTGKLSHIFLVGGCDGHEPQRDYYSKLGQVLPKDTMVRQGKGLTSKLWHAPRFIPHPRFIPPPLMPIYEYPPGVTPPLPPHTPRPLTGTYSYLLTYLPRPPCCAPSSC